MMIKVFTLNKNNKIEFTKEELQALLNQSFWEGYYKNNHTYTYTSPWTTINASSITTATDKIITTATNDNSITIKCNNE